MTDVNKMLVTEDGIRVSPDDAEKFGLKTEGEVKLRSTGDRARTTTALGRAAVKDDQSGHVITSAAERGADDGGSPYGENIGLGKTSTTAPPAEANPSAGAPADTAAADKDKGDDDTPADQDKRSGDDNRDAGDQPKNRARRASGN